MQRFDSKLLAAAPVAEWTGGALVAAGATKVLVHERAATSDRPPNEDHVALGVADLEAARTELRAAGFSFLVEPREYPWGRSAYLRDPDSRLVELAEVHGS